MRLLTALILVLGNIIGSFQLSASNTSENNSNIQYLVDDWAKDLFTYEWMGNAEDLYLKVDLHEGLKFGERYTFFKVSYDGKITGRGCEITCRPKEGEAIFSSDDENLQEVTLTAIIENDDDDANTVHYTVTIVVVSNGENKGKVTKISTKSSLNGSIENSAIDLNVDPEFLINYESEGIILFKNSFPFSELE